MLLNINSKVKEAQTGANSLAIIWSMAGHRSVARCKHHQENMHSLQIKKQLHCLEPSQKPSGVIRVSPVEPARASFGSLTSLLCHRSLLLGISVPSAVFSTCLGGMFYQMVLFSKKPTDYTDKRETGRIRPKKRQGSLFVKL